MTTRIKSYKRLVASLGLAAILTTAVAAPALAENEVSGTVTPGSLTASVANASLGSMPYSHTGGTLSGTMNLSVNDETGTGDGWSVTVQAGDFVGTETAETIPAANLSITGYGTLTVNGGQDDAGNNPAAGSTGALGSAVTVLTAATGFGQGSYTQPIDVSLEIDALTLADTYTSTLTVLTAAAPE